ncbi:MAG: sulfatase [Alphaproteobacteria bacterium]
MRWIPILTAALVLHLLLAFPNRIEAVAPAAFLRLTVELPLVLLALAVLPLRWRGPFRIGLVLLAALLAALKIADMASHAALARPFHPLLDLHLAAAAWELLSGAIGLPGALLAAAALAALLAATVFAVAHATAALAHALPPPGRVRTRPALAGLWLALLGAAAAAVALPPPPASAGILLYDRAATTATAIGDLRDLRREAAVDAFAGIPDDRLLARLAGRDVLIVFIESYGRSAMEDARYAPTVLPALDALETAAAAAGYGIRSGWLTAPMVGGQSWLAHGTLLSGLWIDGQRRYDSLVAGEPRSLVRDFGRAGWRTAAVMPAITAPWPEGLQFGFDRIHAAADLGYAGEPFNWVTMPDQFTLAALHRRELDLPGRPPVMTKIALISSHAPWTPIPPVLDWDVIGDGSVFTPYALSGDPPAVVWRDAERVRRQYVLSVDYVLRTLAAYVETYGRDDLVLVLLGDHQPAPLVTGADASFDVPAHILAADAVIGALDGWNWSEGARPGAAPVWRMDAFRERFLTAFTPPADTISRLVPATATAPRSARN